VSDYIIYIKKFGDEYLFFFILYAFLCFYDVAFTLYPVLNAKVCSSLCISVVIFVFSITAIGYFLSNAEMEEISH
jgi:hypothetical protein